MLKFQQKPTFFPFHIWFPRISRKFWLPAVNIILRSRWQFTFGDRLDWSSGWFWMKWTLSGVHCEKVWIITDICKHFKCAWFLVCRYNIHILKHNIASTYIYGEFIFCKQIVTQYVLNLNTYILQQNSQKWNLRIKENQSIHPFISTVELCS